MSDSVTTLTEIRDRQQEAVNDASQLVADIRALRRRGINHATVQHLADGFYDPDENDCA